MNSMNRTIGLIECNYAAAPNSQLTRDRPAASLPFHGRYRMVDFAMSNMTNAHVGTVGLILPSNYRSLVDHLGAGKEWGLARKRGGLFPSPGSPFGTARVGGRFLIGDLLMNKAIFMRNDFDYVVMSTANFAINLDLNELMEAHLSSGAEITLLTQTVPEGRGDKSVVRVYTKGERVTGTSMGVEPGQTAFLDILIIDRKTLFEILERYQTNGHLDLLETLTYDFDRVKVQVCDYKGYAAPVFNVAAYYDLSMELLDPERAAALFPTDRTVKTKSHDSTPAKYEVGCKVRRALVSSSCRISGEVEGSVLGRHVVVEPGAVVRNSIIMQGVVVKSGAIVENAIIDRNNTIQPGTVLKGTPTDILYWAKSDVYRSGTDD